jgi:hypothetical protein
MDKFQEVSDLQLNLTLFSNPQNEVENYVYCKHVKDYLLSQHQKSGKDIKDIAYASGYAKLEKFKKHLEEWQKLEKPIPRKYLQVINVDIDTLLSLLELDKLDYEAAIKIPRKASACTVRLIPGIYSTYSFGGMVSEEEAINLAKDYSKKIKCQCMINFPGLFLIVIYPDGKVSKSYYHPSIDITKEWVQFGWDGSNLSSMRIK